MFLLQAENAAKVAAGGSGVLCRQAPAYRSGHSENVHYTKEYVAWLIRQVSSARSSGQ